MNRRSLLAAAGAIGGSTLMPSKARGAQVTLGPTQMGLMQRAYVQNPQRVTQDCMLWCWAASISMIFAAAGHRVAQERIVSDVYRQPICAASGNPVNAVRAMGHAWTDDDGSDFTSNVLAAYDVYNGVNTLSNGFIVNELINDRPLLYMNQSHAMVIVSVDYVDSPYGPQPQAVGVLDPWPYSPAFHFLQPLEMRAAQLGGQMTFCAAVQVA